MDRWKYRDVSHRDHVVCNPLSVEKLDELVQLLELPRGARVLDIACGKAELLVRLAERYGIEGHGVDLSPFSVRDARARAAARVPGAALHFHEQDGATYRASPASYDLAMCVGASWTFGGHRGTLQALQRFVRPGGLVVAGEPFWKQTPPPEYLEAAGLTATDFETHQGNVETGVALGLTPLYTLVGSDDDWDRYEGLQWRAAERHLAAHPDDPDAQEIARSQHDHRDTYLRWGRDTLGWAVYLFCSGRAGGGDAPIE